MPSLTGLRAVAALAVFVNHCGFFVEETSWNAAWSAVRPVGICGLLLFFVLSGYLRGQPGALRGGARAYALPRAGRIHPVYLLALLLSAASIVHPEPARTVVAGLVLAAVVLALSVVVSAVTHRYVEEPGRRWVTRATTLPRSPAPR